MLDTYFDTTVTRISPEAPVPVANIKSRWSNPGGSANVACNLASLGAEVTVIGICGEDECGSKLLELLYKHRVVPDFYFLKNYRTINKIRIVSAGQQFIRLDNEIIINPTEDTLDALKNIVSRHMVDTTAVVISDYDKGVFRYCGKHSFATDIIEMGVQKGIDVIVDPKGTNWDKYRQASCVTPNTKEFQSMVTQRSDDVQTLAKQADTLMQQLDISRILITRSEKGMLLIEGKNKFFEISAVAHEVVDVSGAGDTSISVLAWARARHMPWVDAVKLANIAAGIVVRKRGTISITLDELAPYIEGCLSRHQPSKNFFYDGEINGQISAWKCEGHRIVFLAGIFDVLYSGYITVIKEAARCGDKLCVCLYGDDHALALSGNPPMQDEESRAIVLNAINCVDAVVVSRMTTPKDILHIIAPDVVVYFDDNIYAEGEYQTLPREMLKHIALKAVQ